MLLGSVVPSIVWAGFFFVVYRSPSSAQDRGWITLVFAVLLEAVVACIRFQQSVSYWTPFGNALSLSGWLLRLGWAVFLISFALSPDHARDQRTRRIALVLAIICRTSALSTAYDAFNNCIGFLFDDIPKAGILARVDYTRNTNRLLGVANSFSVECLGESRDDEIPLRHRPRGSHLRIAIA